MLTKQIGKNFLRSEAWRKALRELPHTSAIKADTKIREILDLDLEISGITRGVLDHEWLCAISDTTEKGNFWVSLLLLPQVLLSRVGRVRLCATPQTAARQAPPSLGVQHLAEQCFDGFLKKGSDWEGERLLWESRGKFGNLKAWVYTLQERMLSWMAKHWILAPSLFYCGN